MSTPEVHVDAMTYQVSLAPLGHELRRDLTIEVSWRGPGDIWAVKDPDDQCLGTNGEWDYEPQPSSRTDEWKAEHRFPLERALALAREHAPHQRFVRWGAEEVLRLYAEHNGRRWW